MDNVVCMSAWPICSFAVKGSISASNIMVQNVCLSSCGVNGLMSIGILTGEYLFGAYSSNPYLRFMAKNVR